MTRAARRWRRLRRWLLLAIAGVLLSAAGAIALARLLLPWWIASPQQVAGWLGERIGREVSLDSVVAHWDGPGPVLQLTGLRIDSGSGSGDAAITLGRARVQLDLYAWAIPGRHLLRDFLLVDATLDLIRDEAGAVGIEGFDGFGGGTGTGLRSWLDRVGHLGLSGGHLSLRDERSGRLFTIDGVELRISRRGQGIAIGLERVAADRSGRLRVIFEQRGELDPAKLDAELFIEASDFPLTELGGLIDPLGLALRAGRLQGRQWTSLHQGGLVTTSGEWTCAGLVLAAAAIPWADGGWIQPQRHLSSLHVALRGEREQDGLWLDLLAQGDDPSAPPVELSLRHNTLDTVRPWHLAGNEWPLRMLAALLELHPGLDPGLRSAAYLTEAEGRLEHFLLRVRDADDWQLGAQLRGLSVRQGAPGWPEVRGLDAWIDASGEALAVHFDGSPMVLAVPGVLREAIALDSVQGMLVMQRELAGGWSVEAPMLALKGRDFAVDAWARLESAAEGGPYLEAIAQVPGASVESAKAFWVLGAMPAATIRWLDRALGLGRVVGGSAMFRGALRDWPFRAHEGRFEAQFEVADARLDFHPDWPPALELSAAGAFVNTSLRFDRASGVVAGARVSHAEGGIPSLKDPVLGLDLQADGDGNDWLRFLKSTPLQKQHGAVMFGMAADGPLSAGVSLRIPLKEELGPVSVAGQAMVAGMQLRDSKWKLALDGIRGRVDFSDSGFAADRLDLQIAGQPAELGIAVGAYTGVEGRQVDARLVGELSAQALFGEHEALLPILARVEGRTPWEVQVQVESDGGAVKPAASFARYRSSLIGTRIDFPAPLGKTAESAVALDLRVPLPLGEELLRLELGPETRLLARLGGREQDFRAQLQFGAEQALDLPSRGLRVSGRAGQIDPAGWAGWLLGGGGLAGGDTLIADIDLAIGQHRVDGGHDQVRIERSNDGWELEVDAEDAKGRLRFTAAADRAATVVAEFERLHVPEPKGGTLDLAISPSMVPTLHWWVRDLRIGRAHLGEARLEAFATSDGLRVDLLEARSPEMEVHAKGDWNGVVPGGESRFQIRITSEDLGRMLAGLGFAGVVAGGQTLAEIDARWRGAPHAFALERLVGTMKVSIGHGRFLDVDPGAGRIFGLLSVRELPRRLALDFRDLFQTGMSFDRIEGRFQFDDGNAWTDNLTVRGPAADMLIIGRTGLASRDYDQQVMVAPRMGSVLTVIGGLAGGPVGAAAGMLAQGVTAQGDIEKSSRMHYSIGGSWEKPMVARLTPIRPDASPRRRESVEAEKDGSG